MKITIGDKFLIAALLILNGWLFASWGVGFSKGDWVVVTVNQKETIRLPLDQDQKTHVKGPIGLTEIEVKNGHARIIRSPCKNKVCIKSGYIRYADRLAACIPNRVVIRIVGKSHRGVDAVIG
ncbi:MAG: NusG domain II-containing protein [Nitrospina sp.]|nr:NusG domain II-containing protein [Nitrospina sp.]|tara:strand:- start:255 stop:623 length:369 start_codon:yes stop_codon:yes gene_type:complete